MVTYFGELSCYLFFMLLFASIGVASAADYYVATWGSDSNPGTEAHGRLFKKPLIPWLQAIPFTSKRGPTMKKLYHRIQEAPGIILHIPHILAIRSRLMVLA